MWCYYFMTTSWAGGCTISRHEWKRCVEIGWVGFSFVITIFSVFSFVFEVHAYNKVGELFMRTLMWHEYNYEFFFFLYIAWILTKLRRFFSLVFLIVENYLGGFPVNFVSSEAYAVVCIIIKKIMKFTLTLLICAEWLICGRVCTEHCCLLLI